MADASEVAKLEKHLSLLRQEYVKLQNKSIEMEQKLGLAAAVSGDLSQDSFISQLLKFVTDLYDKEIFSDITIKFANQKRRAHKVVLAARSAAWSDQELNETEELELEDITAEVGNTILKWIYTDKVDIRNDEKFIMDLVRAANTYKLTPIKHRCEKVLMSSVTVSNCIKFYQTAEDIGANALRKYCAEIIASHWNDLNTEDFAGMSAPLLYDMFKAKSPYPLHFAIRHHREDVVFLYLIEYNAQVPEKLNEKEGTSGEIPLEIALKERQESIAKTLINHGCAVDSADSDDCTLLHRAIENGDEFAATFLIQHGADVKATTEPNGETPLHIAASYRPWSSEQGPKKSWFDANMTSSDGMARVARMLLERGADSNAQNAQGRTPLHLSLAHDNEAIFNILLAHPRLDMELRDGNGDVVLWFAILSSKVSLLDDENDASYAARLVKRGSSADAVNPRTGDSLLHLAAFSGNESAGLFLLSHGAKPNHTNRSGETPLHAASVKGLAILVKDLLNSGANPNSKTFATSELRALASARKEERDQSLKDNRHRIISLEKAKAMKKSKELKELKEKEIEAQSKRHKKQINVSGYETPPQDLQQNSHSRGSSFEDNLNPFMESPEDDEMNPFLRSDSGTGNEFLDNIQAITREAMELSSGMSVNFDNNKKTGSVKTTALPSNSVPQVTTMDGRIDFDMVTTPSALEKFDFDNMKINELDLESELDAGIIKECWDRTPVHVAVAEHHELVVRCFIDYKENACHGGGGGGRIPMVPDFNIRDSEGQTPLELSLWTGQHQIARSLIDAEADINDVSSDQQTLLHKAIKRKDLVSCLFLLESGADINKRYKDNMSPLQMAIHLQLEPVVDALCKRGANVNSFDENGNTPLWVALKSRQMEIAATLVKNGCDSTAWNSGLNGCRWTLLHRGIHENDEDTGCFLIRNKCDVNSPRKPGPNGEGGVEAWDVLTPLHLACAAGQDKVVQCLVENNADINARDSEGRTPVYIAITNHNPIVSKLLLSHPELNLTTKDRTGQTPFVVAMNCKDNDSAAAILTREPSAAEQFDNKGRNYLHLAVQNNDVESVLFLISIEVNANSHIQDSSHRTPLHLAIPGGREVIVRHLILAGADVNALDKNRQSPVHVAAVEDKAAILSILLQNGAEPDTVDMLQNNPLHLACQHGNLGTIRVLLTESRINAFAYNAKGQNPLHILASYSKDNAAAIFELFRQTMPDYPFDAFDADENTALFLAYTNGAVGLCCALLRAGVKLGTINKQGLSLFNAPVATKKLLYKLLDLLNAEPGWSDGPHCHECGGKFNVTTRKHHCRHCGRLLCAKCSSKQMPILKYELTKPVRVCEICFDFLTVGPS